MAENPPTDPPADPKPTDPPKPPETGDNVEQLRAALKKANKEAERHRLRAKELEDAGKSELQKAIDDRTAAQQRADNAERELMRAQIARRHGLDDEDMEFVSGSTEDEIEASAVKLAGRILRPAGDPPGDGKPKGEPKTPPTQRPAEHLRGGGDPTAPPEETDPAKLAAAIPRT